MALAALSAAAVGVLEACVVFLGSPAPAASRWPDLLRAAVNYGLCGTIAGAAVLVVGGWLRPPPWVTAAVTWTGTVFVVIGWPLNEDWLRGIPFYAPTSLMASAAVLIVAGISALGWIWLLRTPRRAGVALLCGLGLVAGAVGLSPPPHQPHGLHNAAAGSPDVVVILIDTMRADHLGQNGDPRGLTPELDRLARQGVQFANAYSASNWTKPSVASLMTSTYPHTNRSSPLYSTLPRHLLTLAGWFTAHGYTTGCFAANGLLMDPTGLNRGFETSWNTEPSTIFHHTAMGRLAMRFPRLPMWKPRESDQRTTGLVLNAAIDRWLDDNASQPFLLYAHYTEPHSPYEPPPEIAGPTLTGATRLEARWTDLPWPLQKPVQLSPQLLSDTRQLYAGEIRTADERVGQLLDILRRHGVLQRSIVVLLSDHGEELLEHGGMGHGQSMFDELVRVAFAISWSTDSRPVRLQAQAVSLVDVFPTLCRLAALPVPAGLEGWDLVPLLAGATLPPRVLWLEAPATSGMIAALLNGHKSIRMDLPEGRLTRHLDLVHDPAEREGLDREAPASDAQLFQPVEALLAGAGQTDLAGPDRRQLEAELRALGYVQ